MSIIDKLAFIWGGAVISISLVILGYLLIKYYKLVGESGFEGDEKELRKDVEKQTKIWTI